MGFFRILELLLMKALRVARAKGERVQLVDATLVSYVQVLNVPPITIVLTTPTD